MQTQGIVSTRQIAIDLFLAVGLALGVGLATGTASIGLVCLVAALGG